MTGYERDLATLKARAENAADFAAGMKACIRRALASPDGECELHRHGRGEVPKAQS